MGVIYNELISIGEADDSHVIFEHMGPTNFSARVTEIKKNDFTQVKETPLDNVPYKDAFNHILFDRFDGGFLKW